MEPTSEFSRALQRGGAEETANAFARVLMAGDAVAAATCFAPSGIIVTPDGTELIGESIRHLLHQLASSDQRLRIRCGRTLRVDDLALCTQYWTRSSLGPEAERFKASTTARLVLRRWEVGWLIHIATPWG